MALPHVGSWEYGGAFFATQGLPMTAVAERLEPPELFDYFVEQRAAMGLTIVPLDHRSGGTLMTTLRNGGLVGLLCDRDIERTGIEVEFFGETTTMPPGPATLALRSGAVLVTGAVYSGPGQRSPGGRGTAARHHPDRHPACRRRPADPGDRHPAGGPHPACPRTVARLPAAVAGRPAGDHPGHGRDTGVSAEHIPRATEQGTTAPRLGDDGERRVAVPPVPVPDAGPTAANGAHAGNGSGPTGELRFRTLEEHESDVVAVVSAEGRFLFVSKSAEALLGYDISNVDRPGRLPAPRLVQRRPGAFPLRRSGGPTAVLPLAGDRDHPCRREPDRPRGGRGQSPRRPDRWDRAQHPRHHRAEAARTAGPRSTGVRTSSSSHWPTV